MNNLYKQKQQQRTTQISAFTSAKVFLGLESTGNGASTRPGADLKNRFRVVPSSPAIAGILRQAYPQAEKTQKGHFLIDVLNIYCFAESIESTAIWEASQWQGNKCVRSCDRHTINMELEELKIDYGRKQGIYYSQKSEGKPCPMRDQPLHIPCVKGCELKITLKFYIKEVFDGFYIEDGQRIPTLNGRSDLPVQCVLSGTTNQKTGGVIDQLFAIQNYVGSIKVAPTQFWNQFSGHFIPLQISRIEVPILRPDLKKNDKGSYIRTEKRCESKAYPVQIQVHPLWLQAYNSWQQQRYLKQFESQQQIATNPETKQLPDKIEYQSRREIFLGMCDRTDSYEKLEKLTDWAKKYSKEIGDDWGDFIELLREKLNKATAIAVIDSNLDDIAF